MANIEKIKEIGCDDGVSFDHDELADKLQELACEADTEPFPTMYIRHQGSLLSPVKATIYKSVDDEGYATWEIVIDAM